MEDLLPQDKLDALEPWERLETGHTAWGDFPLADKDKIVRHYAPNIRYLAARLKSKLPRNVDLSELISSGTLGLLEALGKFKPQLGIRFETYAENRIRGAMLDELRKLDWFPRSLRQRVRKMDEIMWTYERQHGHSPSVEQVAELTGLPLKEVQQSMEALQNQLCVSLDIIQDSLASEPDTEGEPYRNTVKTEMLANLASIIGTLTPREKLVLSLYYSDELNMREAAEVMGITEGRISQLHSQALIRLRREFHQQFGESCNF